MDIFLKKDIIKNRSGVIFNTTRKREFYAYSNLR